MQITKIKSKFESEVHLGLIAIVFLLLFLNFISNFIIYKAQYSNKQELVSHFKLAGLATGRAFLAMENEKIDSLEINRLMEKYRLTDLAFIPIKPVDGTEKARKDWFGQVLRKFSPAKFPGLADKLYLTMPGELARGDGSEYHYLYSIHGDSGSKLLVLSSRSDMLAYLDDARKLSMYVQLGSLALVMLIYLLLSRLIFKPFRKIKEKAAEAGREINEIGDDTEAVVLEYERMIEQLREKETELLRLNEAVSSRAESLEQFNRFLLDSSHSGLITLNHKGMVASVNETASKLLAVSVAEELGLDYRHLFANSGQLLNDLTKAVTGDEIPDYSVYSNVIANNPDIELGVTISIIQDSEHSRLGTLIIINDLTELVQLRRELEEKDRLVALGEMAAGLAHQIRNSLGAIAGYGTLLKKKMIKAELPPNQAESLLNESREAEALISRFLSFAKPFEYSPELINFDNFMKELLIRYQIQPDYESIKFEHSFCSSVEIMVDSLILRQAIDNIVDNACQAYISRGYNQGDVKLTTALSEETLQIKIEDNAGGISQNDREMIFTPFFSTRASGTGLGLPLASKIINMHSGRLSVTSDEGIGSCFTISLPIESPDAINHLSVANSEISLG